MYCEYLRGFLDFSTTASFYGKTVGRFYDVDRVVGSVLKIQSVILRWWRGRRRGNYVRLATVDNGR